MNEIYSNLFPLLDVKKLVRLFNDDYDSIECLMEINFVIDENEPKTIFENRNDECFIIKVPLYNERYPFIDLSFKKLEKNEEHINSKLLKYYLTKEYEMKFL